MRINVTKFLRATRGQADIVVRHDVYGIHVRVTNLITNIYEGRLGITSEPEFYHTADQIMVAADILRHMESSGASVFLDLDAVRLPDGWRWIVTGGGVLVVDNEGVSWVAIDPSDASVTENLAEERGSLDLVAATTALSHAVVKETPR